MIKKLSPEYAQKILSDVPSEKSFWVHNGPVLKNIQELSSALRAISDDQFTHHLNSNKNDFAKWISEVIGDQDLSKTLQSVKSKTSAIKKINERIDTLKKATAS